MTTALLFSTRRAASARAELSDGRRASGAANLRPPRAGVARAETVPGHSYGLGREVTDAHQVVGGEGQRKHPVHAPGAAVPRLAHEPHRLQPAEDLLDALPAALAHGVARMAGGPAVDRTGAVRGVRGHVRSHAQQPDRGDKIPRVIPLVGAERNAPLPIPGAEQLQRRRPDRKSTRLNSSHITSSY